MRFNAQIAAFVILGQPILTHDKAAGSDADGVIGLQPLVAFNAHAVDEGAVGTAQVTHAIALAHTLNLGMVAGHGRRIEHDIIAGITADG